MSAPAFLLLQSIMSAVRRSDEARREQHARAVAAAKDDERQRAPQPEAAPHGSQFGCFVIDDRTRG